jgi:hypothetical protein
MNFQIMKQDNYKNRYDSFRSTKPKIKLKRKCVSFYRYIEKIYKETEPKRFSHCLHSDDVSKSFLLNNGCQKAHLHKQM